MNIKGLVKWLLRGGSPYEPLIAVEISGRRLRHNLDQFRKLAPKGQVAPVLKSNAYGHDMFEVAHALKHEPVPFYIVDSYFEARALRSRGFRPSILVIGYTRPEIVVQCRLKKVAFAVTDMTMLRRFASGEAASPEYENSNLKKGLLSRNRPIHIHLKIDTGMRRQGILPTDVAEALDIIENNTAIILEGLATHFADAEDEDPSFTEGQIRIWNAIVARFTERFPDLRHIHASNTAGHHYSSEITANISRLGLGLYGLTDGSRFTAKLDLQPALEMKTIITGLKKIKPGESVGYGNTFTAGRDMTIATVPAGYYEGVDRRLSGAGFFLVGPSRIPCAILGRVSMNITVIDVSGVPGININDEVVMISNKNTDPNSAVAIAKLCGTIPYETVVKIPPHLKRTLVD